MLILNQRKVKSELKWDASIFILLNDFELMRVEVEVGEMSFKHE